MTPRISAGFDFVSRKCAGCGVVYGFLREDAPPPRGLKICERCDPEGVVENWNAIMAETIEKWKEDENG